jgi:serine/threonine-protein kinase PRP4
LKATASKPPPKGTNIDRPTRDSPPSAPLSPPSLDGASSPRRRRSPRPRSRSPYRDNRSSKRRRDDDYEYESRYESRHSRPEPSRNYGSRYDDRNRDRSPGRRPKSYYDYDRDDSYGGGLRYSDDHDRRQDKRQRTHSRSPYRESRKPKRYSGDELDQKVNGGVPSADSGRHRPTEQVLSERGKAAPVARDSKLGAETRENQKQAPNLQASVADEYVD